MTVSELHKLLDAVAAAVAVASSGVDELAAWSNRMPRRHVRREELVFVTDLLPVDDPDPVEIELTARRVGELAAELTTATTTLRRAAGRSPHAVRMLPPHPRTTESSRQCG